MEHTIISLAFFALSFIIVYLLFIIALSIASAISKIIFKIKARKWLQKIKEDETQD